MIIDELKKFGPLSDNDCESILGIFTTTILDKGEHWIEANKKTERLAFVDEGYLRKYYVKEGDEVTDSFYFENDFCADLPSIIGNTLPHATIVAMKKTTLTTFTYTAFNDLCRQSPALEHIYRLIVEHAFLRFYNRTLSFIMKTPTERYDDLMASSPDIIQKATQYHIASYLGITAQHLSRLRAGN
jgi:CRP-like cAMP-binding protein